MTEDDLMTRFVTVGREWARELAAHPRDAGDVCHDNSCYVCRLRALLSETERRGAAPVPPPMDKSEFGWLVERPGSECAEYLAIGFSKHYWTEHHEQALRFARKVDAEEARKMLLNCDGGGYHRSYVAEHAWCHGPDLTAPAPTEGRDADA